MTSNSRDFVRLTKLLHILSHNSCNPADSVESYRLTYLPVWSRSVVGLIESATLSSAELGSILFKYRSWEPCSWDELLRLCKFPAKAANRFQNCCRGLTSFDKEEIVSISRILDEHFDDAHWYKMKIDLKLIYDKCVFIRRPLSNVFAGINGNISNEASEFNRKCTGKENGAYLIIRWRGNTELIIAYMLIKTSRPSKPVAEFLTYRPRSKDKTRRVRGVIFEQRDIIYSFGRTRNANGFRSAILKQHNVSRGGFDRTDLCGVRLGLQEDPDRPFAYPIYCYQLIRKRQKTAIRDILGYTTVEQVEKSGQVDGIREIYEKLTHAARHELGSWF